MGAQIRSNVFTLSDAAQASRGMSTTSHWPAVSVTLTRNKMMFTYSTLEAPRRTNPDPTKINNSFRVSLPGQPFLKQLIQFDSLQGVDFKESARDEFKSDSVFPKELANLLHDGRIGDSEAAGNFEG
jgi:hypothetical protein